MQICCCAAADEDCYNWVHPYYGMCNFFILERPVSSTINFISRYHFLSYLTTRLHLVWTLGYTVVLSLTTLKCNDVTKYCVKSIHIVRFSADCIKLFTLKTILCKIAAMLQRCRWSLLLQLGTFHWLNNIKSMVHPHFWIQHVLLSYNHLFISRHQDLNYRTGFWHNTE